MSWIMPLTLKRLINLLIDAEDNNFAFYTVTVHVCLAVCISTRLCVCFLKRHELVYRARKWLSINLNYCYCEMQRKLRNTDIEAWRDQITKGILNRSF